MLKKSVFLAASAVYLVTSSTVSAFENNQSTYVYKDNSGSTAFSPLLNPRTLVPYAASPTPTLAPKTSNFNVDHYKWTFLGPEPEEYKHLDEDENLSSEDDSWEADPANPQNWDKPRPEEWATEAGCKVILAKERALKQEDKAIWAVILTDSKFLSQPIRSWLQFTYGSLAAAAKALQRLQFKLRGDRYKAMVTVVERTDEPDGWWFGEWKGEEETGIAKPKEMKGFILCNDLVSKEIFTSASFFPNCVSFITSSRISSAHRTATYRTSVLHTPIFTMAPHLYHILFHRTYPFLIFGRQTIPRFTFNTIKTLAFGHLIFTNFFSPTHAVGVSMLPTLHPGFLLLSRLHARGNGIRVGDMVTCVAPYNPERRVLKRVIGLEGDFVLVDPEVVDGDMVQVPKGHIWICGDNLNHSRDSRHYGPVPLGLVTGKVVAELSPEMRWLENSLVEVP